MLEASIVYAGIALAGALSMFVRRLKWELFKLLMLRRLTPFKKWWIGKTLRISSFGLPLFGIVGLASVAGLTRFQRSPSKNLSTFGKGGESGKGLWVPWWHLLFERGLHSLPGGRRRMEVSRFGLWRVRGFVESARGCFRQAASLVSKYALASARAFFFNFLISTFEGLSNFVERNLKALDYWKAQLLKLSACPKLKSTGLYMGLFLKPIRLHPCDKRHTILFRPVGSIRYIKDMEANGSLNKVPTRYARLAESDSFQKMGKKKRFKNDDSMEVPFNFPRHVDNPCQHDICWCGANW